jgi:hypothetical protein
MVLSSGQRTGFAICLVLTILLVGLHFAGNPIFIQLLAQAMFTTTMPIISESSSVRTATPIIQTKTLISLLPS